MPSGAKPGERRGGRPKGAKNKMPHVTKLAAKEGVLLAKRKRWTPLQFLLGVGNREPEFRDHTAEEFAAMVAAAPYCHARLAAVAYVPPPDDTQSRRREMLRQLSYQQRKAIEDILLAGDIEGALVPNDEQDGSER